MRVRNEIKAGLFVMVSLAFFALSILIMGRERQLFSKQLPYTIHFDDVKGLAAGAPVRLGGITIGRVDKIHFTPGNGTSKFVEAQLLVNESYADRIKKDTEAFIETQGLLGDKFLSLSNSVSPEILPVGSEISPHEGGDISEVLTRATTVVERSAEVLKNINEIAARFKTESLGELIETSKSLSHIAKQIETNPGVAHDLFYSEKLTKNLSGFVHNLNDISEEIKKGSGLAHTIIYPSKETKEGTPLGGASLSSLATMLHEVEHGKGLLHYLIYEKSGADAKEVLTSAKAAVEALRIASQALSQGSGTLGALLIDPSLYNNLVEVTNKAKRSFLLREAIKSSITK